LKRYTEQVFTRLSKADNRLVKRDAKREMQSPSEWIRGAIWDKLENSRKDISDD